MQRAVACAPQLVIEHATLQTSCYSATHSAILGAPSTDLGGLVERKLRAPRCHIHSCCPPNDQVWVRQLRVCAYRTRFRLRYEVFGKEVCACAARLSVP
jgi:hypothetical protein